MKMYFMGVVVISLVFISLANDSIAQVNILKKAKQKVEGAMNGKPKADSSSNKTSKESTTTEKSGDKNTNPATTADTSTTGDKSATNNQSIKAYSKYDFVPGEKVIGFEDFSTGNIGDFPAGWNTNASAELVTIEGKPGRWLMLTKPGVFLPEFTENYPEDFTFEFDLLHGVPISGAAFTVVFVELDDINKPQNWTLGKNHINFELSTANTGASAGLSRYSVRKNSTSEAANQFYPEILNDKNNPIHISVWRQKERVRVYANQEKLWDIPKGVAKDAKLNAIVFYVPFAEPKIQHYIGNLRLAVGAPDTRNKLLTDGKWITHGILFDVNSANIKSDSYGTLKEIANVLKENADVKVKIIGHTDSDGNDASNLDLSKRRAESVKTMLAKEFGIEESRMQTDGMGESKPIEKNDTPAGKANNRRVEFVKF